MSWNNLPTDYTDAQYTGLRKYQVIDNGDGTKSFYDVTEYTQEENSFFSASDANSMNGAINDIMAGKFIAVEFSTSVTYSIGDYVVYDGDLYRFTSAHTGAWNSSHVTQIVVTDELGRGGTWGNITGTLSNQTDLQNALNAKANAAALGTMASVNDAPSDDSEYVRKNGAWSTASGGSATYTIAEYYVSPEGSDSDTGKSESNPFLTIQKAVDSAPDFGITYIYLLSPDGNDVTFNESVRIVNKNIVWSRGSGSFKLTISGNLNIYNSTFEYTGSYTLYLSTNLTVIDSKFTSYGNINVSRFIINESMVNIDGTLTSAGSLSLANTSHVYVTDFVYTGTDVGIYCYGSIYHGRSITASTATTPYTISLGGRVYIDDDADLIPWGNLTGTLSDQTDLQDALDDKADIILHTVSGDIAHIEDAGAYPAEDLVVGIEPVQDLHGYDGAWVAGGGVNLVNPNTLVTGYPDGTTGEIKPQTSTEEYTSDYIPVTESTTYTGLYSLTVSSPWVAVAWYDENKVFISRTAKYAQSYVFTSPSGSAYARVSTRTGGNGSQYMLFGEGTITEFSPYENICPISGHAQAVVTRTGKNLLDLSELITTQTPGTTTTLNADGSVTLSGTASATWRALNDTMSVRIPVGTYTFSILTALTHRIYVRFYHADGTNTDAIIAVGDTSKTITLTEDAVSYRVFTSGMSVDTAYNETIYMQLELGSSASDYEAYSGTSLTIDLDGTRYGGTLDVRTGVLTVTHGIYTFAGDEVWNVQPGSDSRKYYSRDYIMQDIALLPISNSYAVPIKTSIGDFSRPYNSIQNYDNEICIAADGRFGISASLKEDSNTLQGVQVVYELAEPLTIQLTANQVSLLLGENNLWCDSGEISVTYKTDTTKTIDKLRTNGIYYAVCDTVAGTAQKEVSIPDITELYEGLTVCVKFTYKNSVSSPTLKINDLDAKYLYQYGTTKMGTTPTTTGWTDGAVLLLIYDGTGFFEHYWYNNVYSAVSLGAGHGICSTAEATTAKTVAISSYTLTDGGHVSVQFTYAVPASATLNINSKGAKPIYYNGSPITAGIIQAGDLCTFVYENDTLSSGCYTLTSNIGWMARLEARLSALEA